MKLRSTVAIAAFALVAATAFAGGGGPRTKVVSKTSGGDVANPDSFFNDVSANGRYIVFSSSASNLPGGDGTTSQVYLRDRQTGKTKLISKNSSGDPGNDDSDDASVSANGRFVVFESIATNLPGAIGGGLDQIYIRDRERGRTKLISKTTSGDPGNHDSEDSMISAGGRFVVFESIANNFPGALPGDLEQVYLRDRRTGRTKLISRTSGGDPADGESEDPAISANGRFVAFESKASNLPAGLVTENQVYIRDRRAGRTKLASKASGEVAGDADSGNPLISANGRFVGFQSSATNFPGALGGVQQAYLRDRGAGRLFLVSRTSSGAPAGDSFVPYPSNDGRFVVFLSTSTSLPGDSTQVYLRDRGRGTTMLLSKDNDGDPADGFAGAPLNRTLTADSRLAFFHAEGTNLPGPGSQVYSRGPLR